MCLQARIVLEELDLSALPPKEVEPGERPAAGAAEAAAAGGAGGAQPPRRKKARKEGGPGGRPPLPPPRVVASTAASANGAPSLLDQLDMLASAAEAAGDFASPDGRAGGTAAAADAAGAAELAPAGLPAGAASPPSPPPAALPAVGGSPLGRLDSGGGSGGGGAGAALAAQVAAAAARKLQQRAVEAFGAADSQDPDSMLKPFRILFRAQPTSAVLKVGGRDGLREPLCATALLWGLRLRR